MTDKEMLKILCFILKTFMNLKDNNIYIYNQKYFIPKDNDIYVCVGIQGEKVLFGNNNKTIDNIEEINLYKKIAVAVDIYSTDISVLEKKDEIKMAFNSDLCEAMMEKYFFKIGKEPIASNVIKDSYPAELLYRYNYIYSVVLRNTKQIGTMNYYDINNVKIFNND